MANLSKSKTIFGFTSPRTISKIIPEIGLLCSSFEGKVWSGNQELQAEFFDQLFHSSFYEGENYPSDPAFAARDRITRAPQALGFIDLKPVINLTSAGKLLLTEKRIDETFTRQLLKFQLPSPYHLQSRTTNFFVKPYLELIRLILDLGSLSKTELAIFFLQLVNISKYDVIIKKIIAFREGSRSYPGSRKMYVHEVFEREILEIYGNEIERGDTATRESEDSSLKEFIRTKKSNMKDYADAIIRYVRATELVTFEKKTLRLIISPYKTEEVQFILSNINREPTEYKTLSEFKEYMFNPYSIPLLSDDKTMLIHKIEGLKKFGPGELDLGIEELKNIFDDLKITTQKKNIEEKKIELRSRKEFQDILDVFQSIIDKDAPDPSLFLEWNTWRSFVMLNYARRIDGNFIMDLDGMPLNTAPGNKPDLEIEFDDFAIMGEVTLSSGETQFKMEGDSVPRHYGNFKRLVNRDTYCIFIAPNISQGTLAFFYNLNKNYTDLYGGATRIIPLSLEKFIEFVQVGVENNFSNSSLLKTWLENQWQSNQTSQGELQWQQLVHQNVTTWAVA